MSRRQKDPLRPLSEAERTSLSRLSRSPSAPAAQVARARALLAVAEGQSYTAAAQLVGREVGDTVARWVAGFNRDGLAALVSHHGGDHRIRYGILTLFHPATGQVHLQPVGSCTNPVLHGWLKERLQVILATMPPPAAPPDVAVTRRAWEACQDGLTERFTLPAELPPLRLLLIWDNLTGHKNAEMVVWLCQHGVMPLYTPLGGCWLNMAESIQRILKRRALDGQHPQSPAEIGAWFQQTAQAWNRQPTPFLWNGKRRQRRRKQRGDAHALGGSGAHTQRPLSPRSGRPQECHIPRQVTH